MAEALPRNADVAAQFELLADILEIEGYDAFRVLAYRRAAALIRDTAGSIAQLALDGKAKQLQGIGKTIEGKIVEIVQDGEVHALTKHKAVVPPDVVAFTRLPGLGPKTARRIWRDLGVTTIPDLRKAAEAQKLRTLSGLGPKLEEGVLKALDETKLAVVDADRPLLGLALPAVLDAVESLREHPAAVKVSEAGSARRRRETVRDLDIIATATDAGGADRPLRRVALGGRGRRPRAGRRRRCFPPRASASTSGSCRRSATATCCSTSPARSTTTSRSARRPCGAGTPSPSTA